MRYRIYRLLLAIGVAAWGVVAQNGNSSGFATAQTATADGHVVLTVRNISLHNITAIAAIGTRSLPADVTHRPSTALSVRIFDSVLDAGIFPALSPGKTYVFSFFGPSPVSMDRTVAVKGVVFDDGSVAGEPAWISTILARRRVKAEEIEIAQAALRAAQTLGTTMEQLATSFTNQKKLRTDARTTIGEKQVVDAVYQDIILQLKSNTNAQLGTLVSHMNDDLTKRLAALQCSRPSFEGSVAISGAK